MSRRLVREAALKTTRAVVSRFRWSDPEEYRAAFDAAYPAVEAGLAALLDAYRRQRRRLAQPDPDPDPDPEE